MQTFLPADPEYAVDINAGFTPLIRAKNLGEHLGLKNLYIKNDCANPTWSFKDRVVTVAATKAREFGFTTLACASTGNLANSVSAHAASAGMEAYVFIPSDLERGQDRRLQRLRCDARCRRWQLRRCEPPLQRTGRQVPGAHAGGRRWAFVNINMRPYYAEGSKTLGYEVAEQLGWRAPEHVVAPMASGSLYVKIWKGLQELSKLWLIDSVQTKMSGAQARGCSPIVTAYEGHTHNIRPVRPKTIAKSLAIGNPADGYYALKVMEESGGYGVASEDEEIVEGIKLLAESEGIFAETAGGVVIAGLKKLALRGQDRARRGDRGVHHGLRAEDAGGDRGRAGASAAHRPDDGVVRGEAGRARGCAGCTGGCLRRT